MSVQKMTMDERKPFDWNSNQVYEQQCVFSLDFKECEGNN